MLNLEKNEVMQFKHDITEIRVGLGWDAVNQGQDVDIDGSVVIITKDKQLSIKDQLLSFINSNEESEKNKKEIVYYGHLNDKHGFIKHMGDNLTGADVAGRADDETILINLKMAPSDVTKLQVIVNIYSAYNRGQKFGDVKNAYVKVYDNNTNEVLAKYDLTEHSKKVTGVHVGDVIKNDNHTWSFKAIGDGYEVADISELVKVIA